MEMSLSPAHRIVILLAVVLLAATAMTVSRASRADQHKRDVGSISSASNPRPVPAERQSPSRARHQAVAPSRQHRPRQASPRPVQTKSDQVVSAVKAGRVVVLLLYGRSGADDEAARAALHAVPSGNGASVFEDEVDHLARYRRIVPQPGIDRTPSILIIARHRQARIIEGFVDPGSLKQYVEDARR
jgi:hypothetical protein